MRHRHRWLIVFLAVTLLCLPACAERILIEKCDNGYLESINGHLVLHVSGTPEEMGHQQGVLLGQMLEKMYEKITDFAEGEGVPMVLLETQLDAIVQRQQAYVSDAYKEEMAALAAASPLSLEQVQRMNFLPELFHCSGFALFGEATADGSMLHGRVLDYNVTAGLQDYALIRLIEPQGRIPWVDVGYAGMIGSVTGMNAEKITIGEMGGGGAGQWDGTPMTFLMREALETATTMQEALSVFEDSPRTCEYYYVISDAKIPDARALATTPEVFDVLGPNETYKEIDTPIPDAVLLSAGDRYDLLAQRVQEIHGAIDAEAAIELMRRPVAMSSNLHDALFAPDTGDFWVANATADGQPASEQPYTKYNFNELLEQSPPEAEEN
ncbi:MAG: C45 family peptidase [Armatimonadota bacterium]